ncbi:MAG: hypothetical protein ACU84J_09785 [Gammaproteobacteria bacterium]
MQVILIRIPHNATAKHITDFLEPALKGGLWVRKGMIESIEIMVLHDEQEGATEYHALVRIEPEAAALRIIQKLNRKAILGKHVAVREYHIRNWQNDKRMKASDELKFSNRRITDRRRYKLKRLDKDQIRFTGEKKFHRTY